MTSRSYGVVVLGLGLTVLAGPAAAAPGAAPRATTVPTPFVAPRSEGFGQARELYSSRARRLVRSYLQLQMLELRKAELDRVRLVIEGKLGPDALFSSPPPRAADRASGR